MIISGFLINNRYEIVEQVGTGGMSDVYKAKDHTLGRYVAIKVLKKEFSQDTNFVLKFRTEAQSAAGLEHPNIVNIYDVGCEQGNYYIVMEYVEGITLKTYIEKKGQLSFKEALSIAIQVGRGIQAAHGKNIIHRDIKPQNVIISTEGKVKVTDFGIARVASSNTINAEMMGSVHYASPEQARNGYVGNTSDIYSLGIVMYEMVTGRVPFDGENMVAIAIQHLQEEMVIPSVYAPNLPISLEKIILKCTQKSPNRRYQTIDELLADLRQSLLTPDKDFVVFAPVVQDKTRVISKSELEEIQQQSAGIIPDDEAETEAEEFEYSRRSRDRVFDEEDEEEDDDNVGFLNKKMEKVVTIMGIVAAIVIVILLVWFIGTFFGVFHFGKEKAPDNSSSAISEMLSENTDETENAAEVEMISLLGMTFDAANTKLEEMGLKLEQSGTEESSDYEPGEIISQSVSDGVMISTGETVTVVVCASVEKAQVPDVTDKDSDIAKNMLEDAGFSVIREYEYSDSVETGKVIRQNPENGESLNKGETVTIYISQGTEKTKVPKVVGQSESEAKAALKEAGFSIGTVTQEYSDTVASGNVISQSITGDEYAAKGATIDIVVSKGEEEKIQEYYCKFNINAATPPEGGTLVKANIELSINELDEPLAVWTNVTTFPYTIQKTGITEADSGTLVITWFYEDEEGVLQESEPQEIPVDFQKAN